MVIGSLMKMLYRLSLTTLLFSTPFAQAHMCDHLDELRAVERARCEQEKINAQSLALETEAVMQKIKKQIAEYQASLPKTWYSKENGKNLLKRVKNGTIAATTTAGICIAAQTYAPHLLATKIALSSILAIPFAAGFLNDPKAPYNSAIAATLGITIAAATILPPKMNIGMLGSFIGLFAGITMYEKWQPKKPIVVKK